MLIQADNKFWRGEIIENSQIPANKQMYLFEYLFQNLNMYYLIWSTGGINYRHFLVPAGEMAQGVKSTDIS